MSSITTSVAHEKIQQAELLMQQHALDTWLILTREGSDPSVPLLIGVRSVHTAALFIRSDGKHIALTSKSDKGNYEATGLFDQVIVYESSLDPVFLKVYKDLKVQSLALNISEGDHLADGLTMGLYMWLLECLGEKELSRVEVSSEPMLKTLRSQKTPAEIDKVQRAIDETISIYETVFTKISCGMTELEIGGLFVEEMQNRGLANGLGHAFDPPLVCIVRCGLAHRKPSYHETEPGDIVIIDFSLRVDDYVSDIARTLYFLKPGETQAPEDIEHAFQTAKAAIDASIDALQIGTAGWEVDAVGRRVIENGGYPTIRHSVGHQVGRATHDGGTILGPRRTPPRKEVEGVIAAGEIYAIEPTVIQDDGLPCMLVEENVVVTEQGPRVLSERQLELILIGSGGALGER